MLIIDADVAGGEVYNESVMCARVALVFIYVVSYSSVKSRVLKCIVVNLIFCEVMIVCRYVYLCQCFLIHVDCYAFLLNCFARAI